jgi:hypothetical protein
MTCDIKKHHRGFIRFSGYDYLSSGAYYITIYSHNRRYFPDIKLDEFVKMPVHIHGIIMSGLQRVNAGYWYAVSIK